MTEEIDEVRNEIYIVIENDLVNGNIRLEKIFDLFGNVKNNNNKNDQENGKEERPEKFFQDVAIQYGESELHFSCLLSVVCCLLSVCNYDD